MTQIFSKSMRLRSQPEFDAVYASGHFAADEVLVVNARANDLGLTRLGLTVNRKVGNAVVRNRWKRRIRESFRIHYQQLPVGLDITVRPRKGAVCDYHEIEKSLVRLTNRLAKRVATS